MPNNSRLYEGNVSMPRIDFSWGASTLLDPRQAPSYVISEPPKPPKVKTRKPTSAQLSTAKAMSRMGYDFEAENYLQALRERRRPGNHLRNLVHSIRRHHRSAGSTYDSTIVDYSYKSPGEVLELARSLRDPYADKAPLKVHQGEWVGVEIECFIPYESFGLFKDEFDDDDDSIWSEAKKMLANKIKANGIRNVSIKSDGSISSPDSYEYFEVELTVFFRVSNKKPLKDLCKLLRSLHADVNRSCGVHVHLDMRHLKHDEYRCTTYARRLQVALPILAKMQPKTRRDNSYCKMMMGPFHGDRYCAINRTAFSKYQTLEIRMHSGSTNYSKLSRWVDLLWRISRAKTMDHLVEDYDNFDFEMQSADELIDAARLSSRLANYVKQRIAIFSTTYADSGDYEDQNTAA